MKLLVPLLAVLVLTACGPNGQWLGGNPLADCASATQVTNAARLAAIAADANAKNNPQSSNMQTLAKLADIALTVAETNQGQACPVTP